MSWHADAGVLRNYQAGTLGPARAASLDAHLAGCAECRQALGGVADRERLDRTWSAIAERVDTPGPSVLERALSWVGISERRIRLIAMTPTLRLPAIAAVIAVLGALLLMNVGERGTDGGDFYLFLVVAPLLPLVGVAAAFNPRNDPVAELVATTPTSAMEVLITRAVAVIAMTTVLTAVASLLLPHGWQSAAWLLPSLGLTAASLALSTWVPVIWTASILGGGWVSAAAGSWWVNRVEPDVVGRFAALQPSGQFVFAALVLAAALVVVSRRDPIECRRTA